MDWYPLFNSLRIAAISTAAVFFLGIFSAHWIAKLPPSLKGLLDVALTLPMVLPPTVVGWLLLVLLGPRRPLGIWVQAAFGVRLVMTWWSAVFATVVVAFPLMYRTARGAFENFDRSLADAGRTLGRSNTWVFWRGQKPARRPGHLTRRGPALSPAVGGDRPPAPLGTKTPFSPSVSTFPAITKHPAFFPFPKRRPSFQKPPV